MSTNSMSHRSTIRASRRRANRDARILRRNIRTAAEAKGFSLVRLSREARIPAFRLASIRLGLGRPMLMTEVFALMFAVDLTVEGLFAGTKEVAA